MPIETIGENSTDDWSGFEDTTLRETNPTDNYGTEEFLYIIYNAIGDNNIVVLNPSGLSNISSSATVSAASLHLWLETRFGSSNTATIETNRLLVSFVETQATWNIRATGTNWTSGGGLSSGNDISATVSDTYGLTTGATTGQYHTLADAANFVSDIQGMVDGTYDIDGFHLNDNTQHADGGQFASSEDATDGQRPFVEVDFSTGGGTIYDYTNTETALASDTNADLMVLGESSSESAIASDSNLDQAILNESLTEVSNAGDSNTDLLILIESITEGLLASDTTNEISVLIESLTETAILSDFESNQVIFSENITEGILASDLISDLMVFGEVKTEGAIAGDFDSDAPLISGPIKITVTAKQPGITIESKQGTITVTFKKPTISIEEWE